ncbi:frizzled-1-like [Diadema setosum]|uniref:frizzled-1-like n=1 Tax=Diadema setosum TaxID=31175 RepID=UPI003B3BD130
MQRIQRKKGLLFGDRRVRSMVIWWLLIMAPSQVSSCGDEDAVVTTPSTTPANLQRLACEPLFIPQCVETGIYNESGLPNLLGHETPQDAMLYFQGFQPLIQYGCSHDLTILLCSVFAPVCTGSGTLVPPCRSLCESVRDGGCLDVLASFGFPWPESLACERYPAEGPCFDGTCKWQQNL